MKNLVLIIIAIVIIIINDDKLKTRLKLFLVKTPTIKILKIESVKKTSGNKIFKIENDIAILWSS